MKLTIAIPTYNRGKYILESVNSIMEQITNDVEIIVCDNASTDNTQEVLSPLISSKKISYFVSDSNGGMDFNFLRCLENAKGDYVLLFSDDDHLLPGAVSHILELIDSEHPDYINLNSSIFINDISEAITPRIKLETEDDFITYDKDAYIKYLDFSITYLSATVIKRELFLQVEDPKKYYGTYFLHAHVALETMNGDKKMIVTKAPYVAARIGNSGGFNLYEVWVHQYKKLLLETAVNNGFSKKTMENIYKKDINGFIRESIKCYRLDKSKPYDMKCNHILYENTKEYFSVWIKTFPVAYFPRFIIKIMNGIEWRLKKIFPNSGV